MRATHGLDALTEREKQTLRLIVRGHDAKSVARHLDLSVHTINERLRDARRKLAVPSSRAAARLLLAREGDTPEFLGDAGLGGAGLSETAQPDDTNRAQRATRLGIGVTVVSILLGTLALVMMPQGASHPAPTTSVAETDASKAARAWLALVDESRWAESWEGTGGSFRELNTGASWAAISQKVRVPLGAVRARVLVGQDSVPAGPAGIEVIKFRTSFAAKPDTIETISLAREGGGWKVVGYYIG